MFHTVVSKDLYINRTDKKVHIHHRIWALCAILSFFALVMLSRQATAIDTTTSGEQHLITVYDQGDEKTFITNKSTIGAALREQNIAIEEVDAVEPATTTKLDAGSYTVNVYRARSVIVEDNGVKTQILTAEQSPKKIVEKTGSVLYSEDKAEFHLANSPLTEGGAGLRLAVDRAPVVNLMQYGKPVQVRTWAKTVGDLLKEKGIVLGTQDGQSVPSSTPVTNQMNLAVWRNGKQTITVEEAIDKPIEEVKNADKDKGFREVQTPGVDGKKNVTYEIDMQNGKEVSRKVIASVTILEPVKEVVIVGTKVAVPVYSGSHADWMTAAGISAADFGYVEKLIQKESGWNPSAVNSYSGACGLVQALPCSKLGPNWNDPVVALTWGQNYVASRYGGWAGAWAHSQSVGWY